MELLGSPSEQLGEDEGPAEDPRVVFSSTPAGATVVIADGQEIGTTPFEWSEVAAGQHVLHPDVPRGPPNGNGHACRPPTRCQPLALTLRPVAPELEVLLLNGGWAEVYVDGRKIDKTAPLLKGYADCAGAAHEIRVVNEQLGVDQ